MKFIISYSMMNESFKFPAFCGITIILSEVLILYYSILFKIRNIRAGYYNNHSNSHLERNEVCGERSRRS